MTASLAKRRLDPAYFTHPPYVESYGPEVADLCALAGFVPDPEQELGLDVLFAIHPDGRPLVFEFANIAPRQNMKSGLLKMAVLGWLYITEQRTIVWSAHDMTPTEEAFRDLVELIEGCPAMSRRLAPGRSNGIYRGNGDESIELATGQRVLFKARTTKGGTRGLAGDKVILDEAFALRPTHIGTLLPTLAARPHSQVAYGSSAGHAGSAMLRRLRDRGRRGDSVSLGYMEYCAPEGGCAAEDCTHEYGEVEGCALDDRENWRVANSALGRRITVEKMQAFRESEPPEEFAREHMGWWEEPLEVDEVPPVFTEDQWTACKDTTSAPADPVAFGVFLAPDRSAAAISVAGRRTDWRIHSEIVPARRGGDTHTLPGTRWLAPRLKELAEDFGPCAVAVAGAADSLITAITEALTEAGVEVIVVNGMDRGRACGQFFDAVTEDQLRHLGDEADLIAATTATKRELRNGWVWADGTDERLEAATVAVHTLIDHGPKEPAETEVWGFWE
ncbi:hypothetical protein [Nocardia puris]|uniref:Phage terminase large subunit-like protein n=1 Tax=Nocardia puris TaxID=208602 RepID=A0A366CYL1_9NOCA|nr:hypothetical protein [Nocardia puris]RBO82078.1 hypothetical protein DFR74_12533 [Nocardia puris]